MQTTRTSDAIASRPVAPVADARPTRIFAYEPPRELDTNLWQIRGSLELAAIPRNMTIYRLPDGRLVLYSVVAMHDDGMRALEALGTPAFMVMPHDRHQMDAPFYVRRYPNLRVLAPASDKARNVEVDAGLEELEALGIRAYTLPGTTYHEAILELPIEGGIALCTCELLGNLTPAPRGVVGLVFKVAGPPGGGFGVSRIVRWREVDNRRAMRRWLRDLAERQDIRMVLVGHGAPVTKHARAALCHASDRA